MNICSPSDTYARSLGFIISTLVDSDHDVGDIITRRSLFVSMEVFSSGWNTFARTNLRDTFAEYICSDKYTGMFGLEHICRIHLQGQICKNVWDVIQLRHTSACCYITHLHFGTFAFWNICILEHLHFGTSAFWNICILKYLLCRIDSQCSDTTHILLRAVLAYHCGCPSGFVVRHDAHSDACSKTSILPCTFCCIFAANFSRWIWMASSVAEWFFFQIWFLDKFVFQNIC
jgi:hypothetical protein